MSLIEPGSREDSYLYRKLAGTHLEIGGFGARMPLDGNQCFEPVERLGLYIDGLPPRAR